jgi:chromosome segregation ATPase
MGRRRAGEDNVRLRQQLANLRDDLAWYRARLREVTARYRAARYRAARARAEIADGQRILAEQLIQRQVQQLMVRDSEIEELRRQLKAASEDTVETPLPAAFRQAAA